MANVTASLNAQNTFTDWLIPSKQLSYGVNHPGFLDLVISGTWAGTVTIQKRHFHGNAPTYTDEFDVDTFTANTVNVIEDHSSTVQYRVGFKTDEYISGTANVRLEQ